MDYSSQKKLAMLLQEEILVLDLKEIGQKCNR